MILSLVQLEVFFFILARIVGVLIEAPVFSSRSIPAPIKTALAVWLAGLLWFVTPVYPVLPNSLVGFVIVLVAEVALGFTIGFICNILFIAIQSAGEIIDMQMGLSVASALDPVFGSVISIVGRLTFFTALVIFLILNGHHMVLSAFHQSFTILPAGKIASFGSYGLFSQVGELGGQLWLTAIKLAAPAVLLIFLSDFTFGIVSRVAPQVNVFMLGFQVKPMLGIFTILLTLPFFIKYIGRLIELFGQEFIKLMIYIK